MYKKKLLLSIDGGGVRGKIVATFLSLLETDLKSTIYDTFDFFAGTSTGALIILGITNNRYSSKQISDLYSESNLNKIFKKSFWGHLPFSLGAKYLGSGKLQFFEEIFANDRYLSIKKTTLINAYDFVNNEAIIFKSSGGSDSKYNPLVSEVANATSAAPTYFPSVITTESNPRNLIDGGVASNNPSLCLISEALHQGFSLDNIRLLSFGTGYINSKEDSVSSKNWGAIGWFRHGLIDDFMIGDSSMNQYQCKTILGDSYLRIDGLLENVDSALDNTSKSNLDNLEILGFKWYEKYKNTVLDFLL